MLSILLALGLQTSPAPELQLLAIRGPLAPGDEQRLARAVDLYGDYGRVAVAEGTAEQVDKLRALGFEVEALGAWPAGARLVVTGSRRELDLESAVLFDDGLQALRAVDEAEAARHGHVLAGCHAHAVAPVRRRAVVPSAFAPPAHDAGGGALAAVAVDDRIVPLVAAVDGANILGTVTQLSSYPTRRSTSSEILTAQAWLKTQLAAVPNLTVTEHHWDGAHAPNVVAELTGADPQRVVVLGAHFDSINQFGSSFPAPGADDNASGSGGLLEAARVLSGTSFEATLRFVWFSGEEFGLLGADAYAQKVLADGDEPLGMLNMDMISHREPGDALDLDLATNSTDPTLTAFVQQVTEAYVPDLPVVQGVLTAGSSDHAAFQANGIPAAFLFEDLDSFSAVIHTAEDTIASGSANDFVLAERITRAFVASAAELAGPVDLALAHAGLADTDDASGPYVVESVVTSLTADAVASVELHWRVDGGPWTATPLHLSAAADTYVGSIPGGPLNGAYEYYLLAEDAGGHLEWLPDGLQPGDEAWSFSVGSFTTAYSDDFEGVGDGGWTHVQIATQDDWQRDVPQGKAGDPSAAWSGARVWGNDLGVSGFNGEYQPNVENRLESPSIDLSGRSDVHLRYRRWLTVEDATFDQATILLDGQPVWQNPVGDGDDHLVDTAWVLHDVDLSALADGDPDVRLRFQLESDGGLEFGGWNVDDLALVEVGPGVERDFAAAAAHASAQAGATIALTLDGGPALAGRTYVVALTASGTAPGLPFGDVTVPLNVDALTTKFLGKLGTPATPGWFGALSAQGTATAALVVPSFDAGLVGLGLDLAWITLAPTDFASVPVHVELVH